MMHLRQVVVKASFTPPLEATTWALEQADLDRKAVWPSKLFSLKYPAARLAREFLAAILAAAFSTAPRQSSRPATFSGSGGFLVPGTASMRTTARPTLNFDWACQTGAAHDIMAHLQVFCPSANMPSLIRT